jgi:integrase
LLLEKYWRVKKAGPKVRSVDKYRTMKKRTLEFFGEDYEVAKVDYYKVEEFRDWIQNYRKPPLAPKTVNDYLEFFSGVLQFELKTTRTLRHNPAEGVRVPEIKSAKEKKPPFDLNDLELIFCKSKEYFEDKHRTPHQFWLPLLGLYTGARLEELCQLVGSDIRVHEGSGIWVIDVNEFDEEKSIKTGIRRLIPIHPFLLELGIQKWASKRPKGGQLWSDLKYQSNRWSHKYVRQFKTFKDKAGIDPTPRWKTYHSFRHTVIQHLKIHDVPEPKAAELVGHKVGGITYGLYGTTFEPEMIFKDVVTVLDWHEQIDLTHLKESKYVPK